MKFPSYKNAPAFTLAALVLIALPASAQDYTCTYKSFGPPNTEGQSVNEQDTVVGQIFNSKTQTFTGFIRTVDGKMRMVKARGDQYTFLYGINDSAIAVGFRERSLGKPYYGFLYHDGRFSPVNYPGASFSYASGINNKGEIVGYYANNSGDFAFLLKNGKYSSIDYKPANSTSISAINDNATMVGFYLDGQLNQHGLIYQQGKFQPVDYPGANWTALYGVNDSEQIVGTSLFPNYRGVLSFIWRNRKFRKITIPNAASIAVGGINNAGDITGWYQTTVGSSTMGFLGTHCH